MKKLSDEHLRDTLQYATTESDIALMARDLLESRRREAEKDQELIALRRRTRVAKAAINAYKNLANFDYHDEGLIAAQILFDDAMEAFDEEFKFE